MPAGHRHWTNVSRRLKAQRLPCYLHQYGMCKFNGAPIDYTAHWNHPMAFSADHIVPTHAGGLDVDANAAPTHRGCNCARHDDPLPTMTVRTNNW